MGPQAASEFPDPGCQHVGGLAFCLHGQTDVQDAGHNDGAAYVYASVLPQRRSLDVYKAECLEEVLHEKLEVLPAPCVNCFQ